MNYTEDMFISQVFLPANETRKGEGGLRTKGFFKHSSKDKPLITVITAVFNGNEFLEETIKSIINQSYKNFEYIIIDGGSTDGTLDTIRKYDHVIDYWVSEKDNGICDAFNKAIVVSMGTYLNFQGDGDGFYQENVLDEIIKNIDVDKDLLISGKIARVDINSNPIYISKQAKKFSKKSLLLRMSLPHQGLFTHIKLFKHYGLFDLGNIFSMDYEHLLRAYKNFPVVILKDVIVAKWRLDGLGKNRELEIYREYSVIKKKNKVGNLLLLTLIDFWIHFKFKTKRLLKSMHLL